MKNLVGLVLAVLAGAASAQAPIDPCMKAYNDEVVAIEREAKARQETGSKAAKERAARGAETRIEVAARQAKKCQEEAKAVPAAVKLPATEAECNARASERMAGIEKRQGAAPPGAGPSPSTGSAGQVARAEEELRVRAELAECIRNARKEGTAR